MPRRDQISDKKKEQLMLEHEQLQQLMMQARSSVRRSSLKEQEAGAVLPEEPPQSNEIHAHHEPEVPAAHGERNPEHTAAKEPLTELDIFPVADFTAGRSAEKKPLTEQDLFPDNNRITAPPQPLENRTIIKVILPRENTREPITSFPARHREEAVREAAIPEAPAFEQEYIEPLEERPPVYETETPAPARTRSKVGLYAALVVAALLTGFAGYYFYMSSRDSSTAAEPRVQQAPLPESPAPASTDTMMMRNETENAPEQTTTGASESKNEASEKPAAKPRAATGSPSFKSPGNTELGQYKVISKAYFHDEADESTRRKAFIIHWNNAVLTPQEEQNGFVYVVFTNHLGQTSKGWLRKQDLRHID